MASFPAWAGLPAPARAAFLFKAADAVEGRVEQIAQDMTAEMGKPLREARMEAARAATILRYSAGEAYRPAGEVYEPSVGPTRASTRGGGRWAWWADHAVELPHRDPDLEARARHWSTGTPSAEAQLRDASHLAAHRAMLRGGRPSGRACST